MFEILTQSDLWKIATMIVNSFIHIWPYLVITIPLSALVRLTNMSRFISGIFRNNPSMSIFLATAVGAFSPFCACGVVPVISALLISGVPLAPVMSFWLASASMDVEIFFLTVANLGWDLAIWRLAMTFFVSLAAGFATYFIQQRGWLGQDILKGPPSFAERTQLWGQKIIDFTKGIFMPEKIQMAYAPCCPNPVDFSLNTKPEITCRSGEILGGSPSCGSKKKIEPFSIRLVKELGAATWMVTKFMSVAFFLQALIILYIPETWIIQTLGQQNEIYSIINAALIGIPVYTSNLSALPMVAGLLAKGMSPASALAFLVSGPTTTIPAMGAVWLLVKKRVFALYIGYILVGALLSGYLYMIFHLV